MSTEGDAEWEEFFVGEMEDDYKAAQAKVAADQGPKETADKAGVQEEPQGDTTPPPPAPEASRPAGRRNAKRKKRSIPWGPFSLAEISSHGVIVGMGATCGLHVDPCCQTECKKAVRFGQGCLPKETLVLRLKRWLVAGLEDDAWDGPKRATHVGMGGTGLADFATGLSSDELDNIVKAT